MNGIKAIFGLELLNRFLRWAILKQSDCLSTYSGRHCSSDCVILLSLCTHTHTHTHMVGMGGRETVRRRQVLYSYILQASFLLSDSSICTHPATPKLWILHQHPRQQSGKWEQRAHCPSSSVHVCVCVCVLLTIQNNRCGIFKIVHHCQPCLPVWLPGWLLLCLWVRFLRCSRALIDCAQPWFAFKKKLGHCNRRDHGNDKRKLAENDLRPAPFALSHSSANQHRLGRGQA